MQKRSDERLVAYFDGELEAAERREVEAWLDSDSAARRQLALLAESTALARHAFDEVLHEPLPARLLAAARSETRSRRLGRLPRKPRRGVAAPARLWPRRPALPIAAALFGLLIGATGAYVGVGEFSSDRTAGVGQPALEAAVANKLWLDNAAADFKLFVSAGDHALVDVPATGDTREALQKITQSFPQQLRLPDLKPWGLNFHGTRLVVVDGRPAAQLVYTTDNKAIGPLALIIGSTNQPDSPPTFDHRQDVNLIHWRHQGRAYALVGQANIGYLWGIGNDVAWQLDAI